jgi:dephospho-CoA kinase
VVVVDCTETTQMRRVHARSGWSDAQTQAVIRAQATRLARLAAADVVLDNDQTTLTGLTASVTRLGHWLGL